MMTEKTKDKDVEATKRFDFSKLDFDVIREREREEARRRLEEMERKRREAEEKAKVPPPKTYSVEEHEAAKKDAFEKGREVGFNQATETQNQHIQSMLENLVPQIQQMIETERARQLEQEQDMIRIAFSVARKVLPRTLEQVSQDEIEEFVTEVVREHGDQGKLTIRLSEEILAPVEEQVKKAADKQGISCELNFVATPDMKPDECRVEWENGGAERRTADLMQAMENLFNRFADRVELEHEVVVEELSEPATEEADQQTQPEAEFQNVENNEQNNDEETQIAQENDAQAGDDDVKQQPAASETTDDEIVTENSMEKDNE